MNANEKTRILIPLDGSETGAAVLPALHPLIRAHRVESTLFHVAETPDEAARAQSYLEMRRKALESQGVATRVLIGSGRPVEEILIQAETSGYDLIAMTTHGRTGLDRVLMGSVAEEVVRRSRLPVLLCRNGAPVGNWGRILVALDGTPGSEEILSDVAKLARSLRATVYLVKVGLSLLTADGYRGVTLSHAPEESTPYLEEIAMQLISQGIPTLAEEREGMADVEIPRLARQLEAGLICMMTEGRPEVVPGLDRSIAAAVIRTAPCPVYVRRMAGAPGIKKSVR
jgi:nucleotide-binding universal stress UspA family protein